MNASPIDPARRTPVVDVLRGWALLSVVLVNYSSFFSHGSSAREPMLHQVVQIFFQAKGWPLLAFLFGYGFSGLIQKLQATQEHPYLLFTYRMALLFLLAVLDSAIYYGDILKDYVILGMVILVFSRVREKVLLRAAVVCFLLLPVLIPWSQNLDIGNPVANPDLGLYTSDSLSSVLTYGLWAGLRVLLSFPKYFDWNLVMLTCGLLGAYAHRVGIFDDAMKKRALFGIAFLGALTFAACLVLVHLLDSSMGWGIDRVFAMERWFQLAQTMLLGSGLCWLYCSGRFAIAFQSLELVGRMTLTNYLVQNVIALWIFSGVGLGLLHRTSYGFTVEVAALLFAVQIFFSHWWLGYYRFGPVEWLWRCLAYRRWFPNKLTPAMSRQVVSTACSPAAPD